MVRNTPKALLLLSLTLFCCVFSSCTKMITKTIIQPSVGNLQQQTDINLVCDGAPAYLLILDSMLVSSPDSQALLMTALQSYSGYMTALGECQKLDKDRVAALSTKSRFYGQQLLQEFLPLHGGQALDNFDEELRKMDKDDVPYLFWGAYGWLTWVRNQSGSPAAIVDLITIEKIMTRLLELDESYQGGSIHLFFGGYHAAKPVMFGGRPDLSEKHFKRAIELSDGTFLLAQTTYAETYARATFNKELHDRLLQEVIKFPLEKAPEFGLSNKIAVNRATRLLAENYFGE